MKNLFVGLIITLFFTACSNDIKTNTDTALTLDTTSATKVFSENNISTQAFTINSEKDTTIKGKSGTTLRIRKNTFVDSSGQIVKGPIEIELKEALDMSDIILGNLTTTYNGNFLESGGMIYTNASSNGSQLKIADGKEIGVVVPSDSTKERMMLFEGIQDSNGINWDNPVAIKNAIKPNESEIRNFCYSIIKPINIIGVPPEVDKHMTDIYKGIIPLKMNKDTTINIGEYVVQIFSAEKYLNLRRNKQSNTQSNVLNTYSEDSKTNYIFSIKKLGWANIDRFFFDPRTKKVDLVTSIENHSEFKTIYVSMIVNNLKMYLPGYQKLDKTFSFTHGDYENPSLPIGETVSILATAYKGDIPYYAIKTITIQEKQNVSFKLQKTTMDKLKLELEEKF